MVRQMTQRELDFAEADAARERRRQAERVEEEIDAEIAEAIALPGAKALADNLGIGIESVSRIHHWGQRRNGQRPPAELLWHAHAARQDLLDRYLDSLGCEPSRKKVLVPAEVQLERAKAKLRRLGEVGEQIIRELGEPPPREKQQWEIDADAAAARAAGGKP